MTIALVTTAVGLGGAEAYLQELAAELTGAGQATQVIAATEIAPQLTAPCPVQGAGIGWAYGPEDGAGDAAYQAKRARQRAAMAAALDTLPAPPRLVLFNANWPSHCLGAIEAVAARGLAFAVHFHLCPHRLPLPAATRAAHAAVLSRAALLGCVSENNRFFLEQSFGPLPRLRVFANGSRFTVSPVERAALAEAPRAPLLLLIGRLDHQKGIAGLLPLLARPDPFRGRRLQILGDGPLRPLLERQIARGGAPVELVGPVSDIRARLSRAEGLLMPSHFEGMSLTLLEALSLGCIPILSRASSATEVVTEGETGFLFEVGDWRSMLGALARFAAADRGRIRRAGLERSRAFTRQAMLGGMRAALTPLLEAQPA